MKNALDIKLTNLETFEALLREAGEIEMDTELHGDDGELIPVIITATDEGDEGYTLSVEPKNPPAKIHMSYTEPMDMDALATWMDETYGEDLADVVDAWL